MADLNPVQMEKYLKGVNYPASKDDLIKQAEQNGADDSIRTMLTKLPNEKFNSPTDVSKAVGKVDRGK